MLLNIKYNLDMPQGYHLFYNDNLAIISYVREDIIKIHVNNLIYCYNKNFYPSNKGRREGDKVYYICG